MLQNRYKGISLFSDLSIPAILSSIIGGSVAFTQLCKENILKRELQQLEEQLKKLKEKLEKLKEQNDAAEADDAAEPNEADKAKAPNKYVDTKPLIKAYNEAYQALLNCLCRTLNIWKKMGFHEIDDGCMGDVLKKLADTHHIEFTNGKDLYRMDLSPDENFIVITNPDGAVHYIHLDNPNLNTYPIANCAVSSFKDWLKAYHDLQNAVANPEIPTPATPAANPQKGGSPAKAHPVKDDSNEILQLEGNIAAVRVAIENNKPLDMNAYVRAREEGAGKNIKKNPNLAPQNSPPKNTPPHNTPPLNYLAPRRIEQANRVHVPRRVVPPALHHVLIHYPVPLVRPELADFTKPEFPPLVYDRRSYNVQLIEIPSNSANQHTPEPVDLTYHEVQRPELKRSIAKGEGHLAHLEKQAGSVSRKNRVKKQSITTQIDEQKKRLEAIGHSHAFPNGDRYIGQWQHDIVHGYGEMKYKNRERYEGFWLTGQADGYGEFDYSNGDRFKGMWAGGKMHGHGTYTFSNGDVYVGAFYNGNENGNGICTYKNGDKFEGEWRKGQWSLGKLTLASGQVIEGIWDSGNFVCEADTSEILKKKHPKPSFES